MPAYDAIRNIADQATAMWFDRDLRDLWGSPAAAAKEAAVEVGESRDGPDGPLDMAAFRAAFEAEWRAMGDTQIMDSTYRPVLTEVYRSERSAPENARARLYAFSIRDTSDGLEECERLLASGSILISVNLPRTTARVVVVSYDWHGECSGMILDSTEITDSRETAVIAHIALAGIVLDMIATDWYHDEQDERDEMAACYPAIWGQQY